MMTFMICDFILMCQSDLRCFFRPVFRDMSDAIIFARQHLHFAAGQVQEARYGLNHQFHRARARLNTWRPKHLARPWQIGQKRRNRTRNDSGCYLWLDGLEATRWCKDVQTIKLSNSWVVLVVNEFRKELNLSNQRASGHVCHRCWDLMASPCPGWFRHPGCAGCQWVRGLRKTWSWIAGKIPVAIEILKDFRWYWSDLTGEVYSKQVILCTQTV